MSVTAREQPVRVRRAVLSQVQPGATVVGASRSWTVGRVVERETHRRDASGQVVLVTVLRLYGTAEGAAFLEDSPTAPVLLLAEPPVADVDDRLGALSDAVRAAVDLLHVPEGGSWSDAVADAEQVLSAALAHAARGGAA